MTAEIARDRLEWILGHDHKKLQDKRGASRDSILSQRGFKAGRGDRLRWPDNASLAMARKLGKEYDQVTPEDRVKLGLSREAFNETGSSRAPALMETMDPAVKIAYMEKEIGKPLQHWTGDDLAALPSFAALSDRGKQMIAGMLDRELERRLEAPKPESIVLDGARVNWDGNN